MSRSIALHLAVLVLIGGLVAADTEKKPFEEEEATKEEPGSLQGNWKLVGMETDGKASEEGDIVVKALEQSLDIKGDKFTLTLFTGRSKANGDIADEARNGGVMKFNPNADPKEIDFDYKSGRMAGKKRKGIYRFVDGQLEICIGRKGSGRPKEFQTKKKDNLVIEVYSIQ